MQTILHKATNTTAGVASLFGGTVFLGSLGYTIAEGAHLGDSLYWTITTMSTVGYGDMSPDTPLGKLMTSVLMLWSVFGLVPIIVSNIVTKVIHDPHLWTSDEKEFVKMQLAAMSKDADACGCASERADALV